MPILLWFLSPIGRWVGIVALVGVVAGGLETHGYYRGWQAHKAKIERQIQDAIEKGKQGRSGALDDLNAGRVPDDWFRD